MLLLMFDKDIECFAHLVISAKNDFLAIRMLYAMVDHWYGVNGTPALEQKVNELRKV